MDFAVERKQLVDRVENVRTRLVPFTPLSVTAITEATAQTLATVTDAGAMLVKRLVATNLTNPASRLTLYALPPGAVIEPRYAVVVELSIPGNTTVNITDFLGGFYTQGTRLVVWEETSAAITLSGYFEEIF